MKYQNSSPGASLAIEEETKSSEYPLIKTSGNITR